MLVLDNELHPETLAKRIPAVTDARGISLDELGDGLQVDSLRGRLRDILSMASYFDALEPGRYRLVVLDALYRFMPAGPGAAGETDNAAMAEVYNALDRHAGRLGCAFACVHHTSKGLQSGKAVTDVGAGAGAQSRAADAHLVLRPHEEDDAVVLDAVVRSWPPMAPLCLRWTFPVWDPDDLLDPADLRKEQRGRRKQEPGPTVPQNGEPVELAWDTERFVGAFVGADPRPKEVILAQAKRDGFDRPQGQRPARAGGVRETRPPLAAKGREDRALRQPPARIVRRARVRHTHTRPPTSPRRAGCRLLGSWVARTCA